MTQSEINSFLNELLEVIDLLQSDMASTHGQTM